MMMRKIITKMTMHEEEEFESTDLVPKKNRKTLTDMNEIYKLILEQHC